MKKIFILLAALLTTCFCYSQDDAVQSLTTSSNRNSVISPHERGTSTLSQHDNGEMMDNRGWNYYDNGTFATEIGLENGGSLYWGVMFPAGSYTGNTLTKVRMYDSEAHTGSIMIYQGGTTAPGTLVYTQAYACTGSESFVEWTLSVPVAVNSSQNLWVVMHNNDGQYVASACNDTGNPNGRWISTDGTSWIDVSTVNDLYYTWMIRAYIETINSFSWDFENGIPSGWTLIDADADGNNWEYMIATTESHGHNNSNGWIASASYVNNVGALTPDNYLVTPLVNLGGTFSFWACAQDASYAAEHFGVAISTNGNTNASSFTTIQSWTMTAKSAGAQTDDSRSGNRDQGNWYLYSVNLSNYAGQTGYIAIRHYNCTDMFRINVDDAYLSNNTQYYTITATANPTSGGTVTGGGSYPSGSTCTLHATPNSGYTFLRWTKNGTQVSTNANYSFTVTSNATYVAYFQQNATNYTITVSANPTNGGTVSGGGTYPSGSTCTIHATPNSGYTFLRWTKNGTQVSTNPDYSFTVTGNATYVAHFQQNVTYYTITATASPTNGGTVTGGGSYAAGSTCTLHAVANSGYTFLRWTKNGTQVSTSANYSFTVTGNATYVAHFQQNVTYYTITATASPTAGGTVTGGGSYASGGTCTLHATPNNGYTFLRWTKNGTQVSTLPDYSFTVTGNATFIAYFQQSTSNYTINVAANPTYGGTVTGGGTYQQGQQCTVVATPEVGYAFTNWTENGNVVSTNASYTFVVNGNHSLVANFQLQSYTVTATANPSNGGIAVGGGTYNYGDECTLGAIALEGYSFVNWTENGEVVSEVAAYSFVVTSNRTCVANFQVIGCTISVSADPEEGGTVTGGGSYNVGATCTLEATPNNGYSFVNWTKDGNQVSTVMSYTFTVAEDASYIAHFVQDVSGYTITASANPAEGGTVTGSGTYAQGISISVVATANEGFKFVNWTENGVIQSLEAQYFFVVDRSRTLVANFEPLPSYTITAMAGANGSITPQGDVQVLQGGEVTFTITASIGATIKQVLVDGFDVGDVSTYTFTNVNQNHTIYAMFSGYDVDEYQSNNLNLYPNPADEKVTLNAADMSIVRIYDLLGVKLYDAQIDSDQIIVPVGSFPAGTYLVEVIYSNGRKSCQSFVVKH